MKQLSLNGKEVLMCECPEGAQNIHVGDYGIGWDDGSFDGAVYKYTPKGRWHLLGLASEIKEEQWAELVSQIVITHSADGIKSNYWCWENYAEDNLICHTATESGLSLLKAHGYKEGNCILLIKK